jgi:hypothetical protein
VNCPGFIDFEEAKFRAAPGTIEKLEEFSVEATRHSPLGLLFGWESW